MKQKLAQTEEGDHRYSMPYLMKRMALVNRENWRRYMVGAQMANHARHAKLAERSDGCTDKFYSQMNTTHGAKSTATLTFGSLS